MNNWYLIPLQSIAQSFQILLNGTNYQMTFQWNDSADAGWQMSLINSDTNTPLVSSAPLITGADCLSGLEYLGIGGQFWVITGGDQSAVPTFNNLGTDSNFYFIVPGSTS